MDWFYFHLLTDSHQTSTLEMGNEIKGKKKGEEGRRWNSFLYKAATIKISVETDGNPTSFGTGHRFLGDDETDPPHAQPGSNQGKGLNLPSHNHHHHHHHL